MDWVLWRNARAFYFVWPWAFCLLALIPLWWVCYARFCRKKWRNLALSFSYASVATHLNAAGSRWRRLLYPITVSLLLLSFIVSLARPTLNAHVPVQSADIMLVLDISLSMMADDIRPNRLEAAKKAAIDFIQGLPADMRVGLEVFAGVPYLLASPTRQHEEVIADLKALQQSDLRPRTEIGTALHEALTALRRTTSPGLPQQPSVLTASEDADTNEEGNPPSQEMEPSLPEAANKKEEVKPLTRPVPARPTSRAIVLLSDGDSHEGYPWERAADDARRAGVVIHSVGIGSLEGDTILYRGLELPVIFDETTLRQIAGIAHGRYFRILKESDFRPAYQQIQAHTVHYEERDVDLSFITAAFGLLVLLGALLLAL
jgi:Ca-activated chloride channel homolog